MRRALIALPLLLTACPTPRFADEHHTPPVLPATYSLDRLGPLVLAARASSSPRALAFVDLELASPFLQCEVERLEVTTDGDWIAEPDGKDPLIVGTRPEHFRRHFQMAARPRFLPITVRAEVNGVIRRTRMVLALERP